MKNILALLFIACTTTAYSAAPNTIYLSERFDDFVDGISGDEAVTVAVERVREKCRQRLAQKGYALTHLDLGDIRPGESITRRNGEIWTGVYVSAVCIGTRNGPQ